jgi:predicted Rossmann-fold nucleotide-binding protein
MKEEGWDHAGINEMIISTDMGERKRNMFSLLMPLLHSGGVGTLEELTEASP